MSGFEVVAGELRAHAEKVDGHAQKVNQALDAANQAMPDGVYGIICQFLPPLFNELEQTAGEALTASRGGLEETSANLRTAAERYEAQEAAAHSNFSGIESGMR